MISVQTLSVRKQEEKEMIAFLNWLDGVLWGLPLIVLMIATGL